MKSTAADDDSNALILPATTKKKTKNKLKPQIKSCQDKKISKSQQRKLRRLEEEKEKEKLLAKSLITLEKCAIRDDVYSLLTSSEKIGQAETRRERLWREMQFSKAGLEMPESEKRPERKEVISSEIDVDVDEIVQSEMDSKNATLQSVSIEMVGRNNTSVSVPSQQSGLQRGTYKESESNESIKSSASEDHSQNVKLTAANVPIFQPSDSDIHTATAAQVDDSRYETHDGAKCNASDPAERPLVPPTVKHVSRPKDVENGRKDLPIIMMEQEIMEAINNHTTVIICGATGCGKTTQIPQFLYEAGYGSKQRTMRSGVIGVTQPRRVAVLSTARRVAYELGVHLGKEVGFQVRHEKRVGKDSSIKFMTDGILLRELQNDLLLKRYSVIILDEAHERSLNTDILIGMLSRVIILRQNEFELQNQRVREGVEVPPEDRLYPLKLVLMSATLRVEDFTSDRKLFSEPPPVIDIPARQFHVKTYFSRRTELVDYIGEAYKKILKIHKTLPPGGILVFVTGQNEVEDLCRKLRQASIQFKKKTSDIQDKITKEADMDQIDGLSMKEIDEAFDDGGSSAKQLADRFSCYDDYHSDGENNSGLVTSDSLGTESESDFESDEEDQNISKDDDNIVNMNLETLQANFEALAGKTASTPWSHEDGVKVSTLEVPSNKSNGSLIDQNRGKKNSDVGRLHVLPLYAMLPAADQLRVFKEVTEGERMVVVATNVAETSLTIPGIKYVVDTGREKVKLYNSSNGMESYEIQWISKASASQRAGRAGRTGPGCCYRLYSSAAFTNEFPDFSCAEILKTPVDSVVLLLKSMRIKTVKDFPFPTRPNAANLVEAEKCLKVLEALDNKGELTSLGKVMAQYPVDPRHSRLLLLAIQFINEKITRKRQDLVLGYAVAVAAALSLPNPFLSQSLASDKPNTVEEDEGLTQKSKSMRKQVKESRGKLYNLKSDALTVAFALQSFEQSKNPSQFCQNYALNMKTMVEMSKLRKQILQIVFSQRCSSLQEEFSCSTEKITNVKDSWKLPSDKCPLQDVEEDVLCQAICAGWPDRVARQLRGTKLLAEGDLKVNAVRYQASMVAETVFLRRWSSISRAAPEFLVYHEMQHIRRPYINAATKVKPEWLVKCAGSMCTYSAPLAEPKPFYDGLTDQVFCYVIPYFGPHLWELPCSAIPIKDVQQRTAVFAYALLDGRVLPCFNEEVKKCLAAQPSSVLKPESLVQKRVCNLLLSLKTRSITIDSCANLRKVWKENPNYLHAEIRDWFQQKFHHQFEGLWTKMHHEILLTHQERFPDTGDKSKRRKISR